MPCCRRSLKSSAMKPLPRRIRSALLYVAAWVPLWLLQAAAFGVTGMAPSVGTALRNAATYFAPAILVGALAWEVARRVDWRRLSRLRAAGMELGIGFAFTTLWLALFFLWLAVLLGRETAVGLARTFVGWPLVQALLIVGMHSAVFHTVRVFGMLRKQELAAAEAEAARARAEMVALRGQLDPHFLFNSLHSITALVREDPVRAEEALLQFAALLRRVLAVKRDSTDEVTLDDELRFVDDYLAIERLRLGERLRVTLEISAEARACRLPSFSVQPLVENAIRHALAPRRDGGTVTIRAGVRAGRLEVSVRDDGPGADAGAVAGASGVGLSVIRQRLVLRHGARATVTVETAPGKGFGVTLGLPAESEGGAA